MYRKEEIMYSELPIVNTKYDYLLIDEVPNLLDYVITAYFEVEGEDGQDYYVPLYAKRGER